MINVGRIVVVLSMALFLSGCMTFEGPDHKYVLKQKGFKEVKEADNLAVFEAAGSISAKQTTAGNVRKRGSNYEEAVGGCGRWRGRQHGRDPDPWASFEFVINKDIDVVYPRIMSEFGYSRLKPVYHYGTSLPVCSIHLRYEEVPGSHYQMRRFLKHSYGNEESENTIEIDLTKEGENKARIRVSYYSGNTLDPHGYEASLRKRIEQALR